MRVTKWIIGNILHKINVKFITVININNRNDIIILLIHDLCKQL